METGPGVAIEQVVSATEAELALPANIPEMQLIGKRRRMVSLIYVKQS